MAAGDSQYYANAQSQYGQTPNNTQCYQPGYWYGQSAKTVTATTAAPTSTPSQYAQPSSSTHQTGRENYGYTNPNRALSSINSALAGELDRPAAPTPTQSYGYNFQTHQQEEQPGITHHQTAHNPSSHSLYSQHEVRPDSVNSVASGHSGYSAPRTAHVTQSTQYYQQPAQSQTVRTNPSNKSSAPTPRWTQLNQRDERASSCPSDSTARGIPLTVQKGHSANSYQTTTANSQSSHTLAPATVNPTQTYDLHLEYQRQRKRAEEEGQKRVKAEVERNRAKAEDERRRVEADERLRATEAAKAAEFAKEAERRAANATRLATEQQDTEGAQTQTPTSEASEKKPRDRKSRGAAATSKVSKPGWNRKSAPVVATAEVVDEPAEAAAMTLMQTANASGGTSLENEMKEMFRKLREYNMKDPEMLARLWQQERDAFIAERATTLVSAPATNKAFASRPKPTAPSKPTGKQIAKPGAKSAAKPAVQTAIHPAAAPAHSTMSEASTTAFSAIPQSDLHSAVTPAEAAVAPVKTSGPTWPAEQKQVLAGEAAKLLLAVPANRGKNITPSQILAILDTHPSYLELCHKIESLGFRLDRGEFARALLRAILDVNKAAQKPQAPTGPGGAVTAHVQAIDPATAQSTSIGVQSSSEANIAGLTNAATRLLNGGSVIEIETPTSNRPKPKMSNPRARKEANSARKANTNVAGDAFAASGGSPSGVLARFTFIDPQLEGLDEVKHFIDGSWQDVAPQTAPPSSAKPKGSSRTTKSQPRPSIPMLPPTKEEIARKRNFCDLVDLTALESDDDDDEPIAPLFPPAKRHESDYPAVPIQLMSPPQTDAEKLSDAPTAPIVPTAQIVAPVDQPESVTVAACADQLHVFPTDAIQTASLSSAPKIPTDHPSRMVPMAQLLDKYKAIRRSTYNPKTIARDILLACGRHPDMRHLNAHYEVLKNAFPSFDNSVDLGTFRWDIADPGGPAPGSGAEPVPSLDDIDMFDADDEEDPEDEAAARVATRVTIGANGEPEVELRGPVGLRNKTLPRTPTAGIRSHTGRGGGANGSSSRPNPGSQPSASPGAGQLSGVYASLRALQSEDGSEPKKQGRPVGWRKWMIKDGPPAGGKLGKPAKTPARPPEPEPIYQVYKCEWRECGAELHNLVTLRKHIYKLHSKPVDNGLFPCLWNDCGRVRVVNQNGRTVSRFVSEEFEDVEPWKSHMEKKHIMPIAWELGDGPAGGLSEREQSDLSDAYMSDSRGRRITPTIVVPSSAASAGPSAAASGPDKKEKDARELQRLAEKRKREIGPGIDKGGARLANDKRRHGFVDDDDTEEIVDAED